jgi:Protein of unknown function (DUF3467)
MPVHHRGKKRVTKPEEIKVDIQADVRPDTPFYYVNFFSVTHSPYDFSISVLRAPSQLTEEQKQSARSGKPVLVEPSFQLVIPPRLIKGIIKALTEQCRRYEEQYGKIEDFKHEDGNKQE